MNKERRKELDKAIKLLEEAQLVIDGVRCDEADAYDSLPEGIQDSEKGERLLDNVDALDSCYDDIQSVIDDISDVIEG